MGVHPGVVSKMVWAATCGVEPERVQKPPAAEPIPTAISTLLLVHLPPDFETTEATSGIIMATTAEFEKNADRKTAKPVMTVTSRRSFLPKPIFVILLPMACATPLSKQAFPQIIMAATITAA